MAIQIDEIGRAMIFRDQEAKKESFTGEIKVLLSYNEGKITRTSMEKKGPLFPAPKYPVNPPTHDQPGKNFG